MIVPGQQHLIVTSGQVIRYLVVTSRQVAVQGWIVHISLPMLTHRLSLDFAQPNRGTSPWTRELLVTSFVEPLRSRSRAASSAPRVPRPRRPACSVASSAP